MDNIYLNRLLGITDFLEELHIIKILKFNESTKIGKNNQSKYTKS